MGLIFLVVLGAVLGWLAAFFPLVDRLLVRGSVLLAQHGRRLPGALERHGVSLASFERELRAHGVRDVAETDEVRLEGTGRVTLLKAQR